MAKEAHIVNDVVGGVNNVSPTATVRATSRLAYKSGESEEAHARREARVTAYREKQKQKKRTTAQAWLDSHKTEPKWGEDIDVMNVNPEDSDERRFIEFTELEPSGKYRLTTEYMVVMNGKGYGGYGRIDGTKRLFGNKNEAIAYQKQLYEKELKRIQKTANI